MKDCALKSSATACSASCGVLVIASREVPQAKMKDTIPKKTRNFFIKYALKGLAYNTLQTKIIGLCCWANSNGCSRNRKFFEKGFEIGIEGSWMFHHGCVTALVNEKQAGIGQELMEFFSYESRGNGIVDTPY